MCKSLGPVSIRLSTVHEPIIIIIIIVVIVLHRSGS